MKARSRAARKATTRARLLAVARGLFTEHGYDGTSIAMVCRRLRMTHGALYHHFPGKLELFEAVLEDVTRELAGSIAEGTASLSGWDRIVAAMNLYLEQCADPAVLAILLRDGPRVVPRDRFDAIDHQANEPLVVGLLQSAVEEGVLRPLPVASFARVLGAAFAEAGSAIAESSDRAATQRELQAIFLGWLGSLRT